MNDMSNTPGKREALAARMRHPSVADEQLRNIIANPGGGYNDCSAAETVEIATTVLVEREAAREAQKAKPNTPWHPATPTTDEPPQLQHKKIVVTFAQDAKACGAKSYVANLDGSVSKVTHSTSSGKMLVMESTVDVTATIDTPNVYVICSVPKDKSVVVNAAAPEAMLDYGIQGSGAALTRTGKHFEFRAGVPGLMVCDLDPKGSEECIPALEYKDPAAYHAILAGVCPALGDADAVSHPSGSHGDVTEIATSKVVKRSFGTHVRFAVKDQGDIPRALKALHERAMLAGHLHAFVDNAGGVHPRSIVDGQLGAVARPVFSCPAGVPKGYELRNRPAPVHHFGDCFDTRTALPDLTPEERKKLVTKIEELKERPAVRALSEKRRAEFLAKHPEWSRSVNSVGRSKDGYPAFLLTGGEKVDVVGVGVMTARELVSRYEELTEGKKRKLNCRDPLDPNYGGDSIAVIYEGVIFSWAHHGRVFRLPGDEPAHAARDFNPMIDARLWSKMVDALQGTDEGAAYGASAAALSYRYALVRIGPAVHVLDRKHLHEFPGSGGLLKKEAFFDLHAALKFELPGLKPVSLARWWFNSDRRHVYSGLVLAPEGKRPKDQPQHPNTFNMWRGFAVEPSELGSCEKFKDYLLHIVCNGDKEGYDWLCRWMAQLVQRPSDKSGVAVVLQGPQGAGKSFFGEAVMSLFHERHAFQTASLDDLTGQFTSHTALAIVVLLDEAFFVGDKRNTGKVKNIVTAKTMKLESKGVDAVAIDNYTRYILTSNEDHVINAELSDRRHTVFQISNARLNDGAYFTTLQAELDGGGRARLLWELKRSEIGDGFIRPYENAARASQQIKGLEPVAAWLFGLLVEGALLWSGAGDPVQVATPVLFEAFRKSSGEAGRYVNDAAFGKRLGRVTSARPTQFTPFVGSQRVRGYLMPTLADARVEFCRKSGLDVDWEAGDAKGTLPRWLCAS
jgi:hypothetical protein